MPIFYEVDTLRWDKHQPTLSSPSIKDSMWYLPQNFPSGEGYETFNIKNIKQIRAYLQEKIRMGLFHAVFLMGHQPKDTTVWFALSGIRSKTWDRILLPGIKPYAEIVSIQHGFNGHLKFEVRAR